MAVTGTFATSKPLINQLQHNIQWGRRETSSTYRPIVRSATSGWLTGDAQVFAPTARSTWTSTDFSASGSRSRSRSARQRKYSIRRTGCAQQRERPIGARGVGDAATVIPWELYLAYGDQRCSKISTSACAVG